MLAGCEVAKFHDFTCIAVVDWLQGGSRYTGRMEWLDGSTPANNDPLTYQMLSSSEVLRNVMPWDGADDSNEPEPATGVELQSCDN